MCERRSGRKKMLFVSLVAIILTWATFPITIAEIAPGVDMSGMYLLNTAGEMGLKFGTDLMFTYGPLGFLYMTHNIGNNVPVAIAFFGLLALAELWILWRAFRRLEGARGVLLICVSTLLLICSAHNSHMGWTTDYYISFVFFLAISLAWVEKNSHRYLIFASLLTIVSMLIKFNTGIQCAVTLALYVLARLFRDRDRETLKYLAYLPAVLIGYSVAFLCYNPSLHALLNYIFTNLEISAGYSSAMSIVPGQKQLEAAILCIGCYGVLLLVMFFVDRTAGLYMAIFSGAVFQYFKHGYVRADMHIYLFFVGFLALVAVVLLFLDYEAIGNEIKEKQPVWITAGFLATAIIIIPLYALDPSVDIIIDAFPQKMHEIVYSVPERTRQQIVPSAEDLLPEEMLQIIGGESVAVLPWELSIGAYNDIDMRVMPALQLLMAYTPSLDKENASFFRDDSAPEYIVLALYTIDGRVPLLETPATWQAIYENYHVVWENERYVLLEKMPAPYVLLLADGVARNIDRTEQVSLPDADEQLFVRIEAGLTIRGKLRKLFYQIPPVNIRLSYSDGSEYVGRVMPELLENGVILDNLPDTLTAVRLEVNGWKDHKPIVSFRLEGDGWEYYQDRMTVMMQPLISVKQVFSYSPYMKIQVVETANPVEGMIRLPEQGTFWVDYYNDSFPKEINATSRDSGIKISGWALDETSKGAPEAVFLELGDRYYKLLQTERADVCQAYYGNADSPMCGYEGWLPLEDYTTGEYYPSLIVICEGGRYYEGILPTVNVLR